MIDRILHRLLIGVALAFIAVCAAVFMSVVGWTASFIALVIVISIMPFAGRS